MDNMRFRVTGQVGDMLAKLKQTDTALNKNTRSIRGVNTGLKGWYNRQRQVNNSLVNLNKDLNRSTRGLQSMNRAMSILNRTLGVGSIWFFSRGVANATFSAMEMTETVNLFSTSLGELAVEAGGAIEEMSKITGLDMTNLQNSVGTFSLLARSMGMTNEQARTLGENTARLAVDLSSLTNVDISQVMSDLRSGLVGQSETVYKYGMDVTEAGIRTEALRQGIEKSTRQMSQGEKMALRYSVMIRDSALAQGDFARTIETPANQLRIFKERIVTLSRAFGSIFIPAVGAVLPYLNAMAQLLTIIFQRIAMFVGFEAPEPENRNNAIGQVADDAERAEEGVGKAEEAVKRFRSNLMGFDEINVLNQDDGSSAGGGGGAGGPTGGYYGIDFGSSLLDDFEMPSYDALFSDIETKSDRIFESMKESLLDMKKTMEPFIDLFQRAFGWTLDNILIPFTHWIRDELIPALKDLGSAGLEALLPILENVGEAWQELWEDYLRPFANAIGDELISSLEWLADSLRSLGQWVEENPEQFKTLVKILTMIKLTSLAVSGALGILKGVFALLIKPIAFLVGKATAVAGFFVMIKSKAVLVWGKIETLRIAFMIFGDFVKKMFLTKILPLVAGFKNAWVIAKVLIGGVLKKIGGAIVAFGAVKALVVAGAVAGIIWMIRNWEEFTDFIRRFTARFKELMVDAWNYTAQWFKDTFNGMVEIAQWTWDAISGIFSAVGSWFGDRFKEAWRLVREAFQLMRDFASGTWDFITNIFSNVAGWFGERFSNARERVGNAFTGMRNLGSNAWSGISNTFANVGGWFGDRFTNARANVSNAFSGMRSGASSTWSSIQNIFSGVAGFFHRTFERAWSRVRDVFSTGGTIFKGITSGIEASFTRIVNTLISGINRVVRLPFNGINRTLNRIRGVSIMGISPFSGLINRNPISVPQMPRLARGGSLDRGQFFEAGELGKAEAIGSYQGKTTVMPLENTDFVSAIRKAVQDGIISASGVNNSGEEKDIILQVDGKEFARTSVKSINSLTKREGKLSLNVT